jgi:hypothetical protein
MPAVLFIAGCSSFVDSTQTTSSDGFFKPLNDGRSVGQTFVARHAGLDGIGLYLAPDDPLTGGVVTLHLRSAPESEPDIAKVQLSVAQITRPGFYWFSLPPIFASNSARYYFFVQAQELTGGTLSVARGPGDSYLDGAAYRDHLPVDRQTAFQLRYATEFIVSESVLNGIEKLPVLFVTLVLFILPGWASLAWLIPDRDLNWAERLGLSAGLSPAIYPLLLLYARLAQTRPGALLAWGVPALAVLGLMWMMRGRIRQWPRSWDKGFRRWWTSDARWPDLAFMAVLLLVIGVRLVVVRGLDAPLWGDSYQHTMISQLIIDNGGLFDSWLPYVPLKSFTYHFGFHTLAAVYHWITGQNASQSVIMVGQITNALAVIALYPLATCLAHNRWAGVFAVVGAGLLSLTPMYYLNWGRYTQLAGQVILPAVLWLTYKTGFGQWRPGVAVLLALAIAGLAVTHYRVLLFYLAFLPGWAVAVWIANGRQWKNTWLAWLRVGMSGLISLLVILPWLLHTWSGSLPQVAGAFLGGRVTGFFGGEYNRAMDLSAFLPLPLVWLAVAGLGWSLLRRRWDAIAVAAWVGLLALLANPGLLRLPTVGIVNNFAVQIALYIPLAVMASHIVGDAATFFIRRWSPMGLVSAALMVALGVWGARDRVKTLDPQFVFVTRPDELAMEWVKTNLPPDARFLVNSFPAMGGTSIVGSDAGWWLPLLTGRQNTAPPLIYGGESPYEPGYALRVNAFGKQVAETSLTSKQAMALLRENGIDYVFIGQQQGRVGNPDHPVILPGELDGSPYYETIYHVDRVWIFRLKSG